MPLFLFIHHSQPDRQVKPLPAGLFSCAKNFGKKSGKKALKTA